MKVKDLRTESNYFKPKTELNSIIEEAASKIATIKGIPTSIKLSKGRGGSEEEIVMKKRFIWFGKEVPKEVFVDKESISAYLEYQEPRDLEQVFKDLQIIEKASGFNFSDRSFKYGCLDLKRFTRPWKITKRCAYSEGEEELGQENVATVEIRSVINSDEERKALKGISDCLFEAKKVKKGYYQTDFPSGGYIGGSSPDTRVKKSWKGQLDEDAVTKFFEEVKRIDKYFGMTLRFLKESGKTHAVSQPKKDLEYKIDLSTGHVSKLGETPCETDYGPYLIIDIHISGSDGRMFYGLTSEWYKK